MKHSIVRMVGAFAVTAAAVGINAQGAQASTSTDVRAAVASVTCTTGYVCVWRNDNYSGNTFKDADQAYHYDTIAWDGTNTNVNDAASSIASRFTRCRARFYKDYNLSGSYITFSYPAIGGWYQDPYLTNGGPGSNANFDNELSSHTDLDCS